MIVVQIAMLVHELTDDDVRGATTVDGNRLDEVVDAAGKAASYVREHSEPYFVEMKTTRLSWHKQGMPEARSKEEIAELAKRDLVLYEEKWLKMTEVRRKSSLRGSAREYRRQ